MINTRYKILFSIEIQHDYFTDGKCPDVKIIPSFETQLLLTARKLKYRQTNNKLIVIVQVGSDDKPALNMNTFDIFRFYLVSATSSFFNYSNLSYTPGNGKKYYFTNLANNKIAADLFLSKPILPYNSITEYTPGDMAINGSGDVFDAIKGSDSGNAHGLAETAFWRAKAKLQYATRNDLIPYTARNYSFSLNAAATNATVHFFKMNPISGAYDVQVAEDITVNFSNAVSNILVETVNINEGSLAIEANGKSEIVYNDSRILQSSAFGVVELFNHLMPGTDYSFFDNTGKVKEVKYVIRFANRAVVWKYIAKTTEVTSVQDSDNNFQFGNVAPLQFSSDTPIPMLQKPYQTFFLESTTLGQIKSLKNAGLERLQTITKDGDVYFCSEIYLNY